MKKLILFSSLCLAGVSAFALPDYEPFADATGSGGTSYTIGSNINGQKDAQGNSWVQAGASGTGTQATILTGDLTIAGLASSGGGGSAAFGVAAAGASSRFGLGSSITSGTVYFSMAIEVTSTTGLTAGGIFIGGFNNASASTSGQPGVVDTRIYARTAAGGFNLGVAKSTTISYDNTLYTVGSTIFVVGSYTFNTTTASDDVAQLWINPSSATFGAGSAPTPTVTDATGADITTGIIAGFELRDSTANEPQGAADDLRIGTSWADVTPPVPEPTSLAIGGLGVVALVVYRRFVRKQF